jgi:hypothetical protein
MDAAHLHRLRQLGLRQSPVRYGLSCMNSAEGYSSVTAVRAGSASECVRVPDQRRTGLVVEPFADATEGAWRLGLLGLIHGGGV